jgi:hypothetical protein
MRKTGLFLIGALLLLFASCKKDVKIDEVNIVVSENDSSDIATDSLGAPITGEIWDEEHRFCQETVDGKLIKVSIYHENGTKAFEVEMDSNGNPKEGIFYNEKGEVVTPEQFAKKHSDIIKKYGWAI